MGSKAPNPREGSSDQVSPTRPLVGSLPSGAVTLQCFLYCLYSLNHHQNPLADTLLGKTFLATLPQKRLQSESLFSQ